MLPFPSFRGTAWQALSVTEVCIGLDPEVFSLSGVETQSKQQSIQQIWLSTQLLLLKCFPFPHAGAQLGNLWQLLRPTWVWTLRSSTQKSDGVP